MYYTTNNSTFLSVLYKNAMIEGTLEMAYCELAHEYLYPVNFNSNRDVYVVI